MKNNINKSRKRPITNRDEQDDGDTSDIDAVATTSASVSYKRSRTSIDLVVDSVVASSLSLSSRDPRLSLGVATRRHVTSSDQNSHCRRQTTLPNMFSMTSQQRQQVALASSTTNSVAGPSTSTNSGLSQQGARKRGAAGSVKSNRGRRSMPAGQEPTKFETLAALLARPPTTSQRRPFTSTGVYNAEQSKISGGHSTTHSYCKMSAEMFHDTNSRLSSGTAGDCNIDDTEDEEMPDTLQKHDVENFQGAKLTISRQTSQPVVQQQYMAGEHLNLKNNNDRWRSHRSAEDSVSPWPEIMIKQQQQDAECAGRNDINPTAKSSQLLQEQAKFLSSPRKPSFRMAAPAHIGTQRYRHGPVPLPELAWADESSVWNLMCWKDNIYCRNPHLMQQHPSIQPRMRAILIDWLSEVCEEYRLHRETFYLAIDFIDRYLSKEVNVCKERLQLIGVTALFVAAKLEEIYPPKRCQFADITAGACTPEDIEWMEMHLLKVLNWALYPITPIHWTSTFLQISQHNSNTNNRSTDSSADSQTCQSQSSCDSWSLMSQSVESTFQPNHFAATSKDDGRQTPVGASASATTFLNCKRQLVYNQDGSTSEAEPKRKNKRHDDILFTRYQRYHFVYIAQLIDLCMLDTGCLRFPSSVLAACAFAHMVEPENLALRVSGFKYEDIAVCYQWMIPFARVVQEKGESNVKFFHDVPDDDTHNIQMHVVDLQLLNKAQTLQQEMLTHSRLSPVFLTNSLANIFPTPPSSDERPCISLSTGHNPVGQHLFTKNHQQKQQQRFSTSTFHQLP